MKGLFQILFDSIKEYRQLKKDYRRLAEDDLDYEALQRMVNQAVEKDVVIEIKNGDHLITIKPMKNEGVPYKSFADKYADYNKGIK